MSHEMGFRFRKKSELRTGCGRTKSFMSPMRRRWTWTETRDTSFIYYGSSRIQLIRQNTSEGLIPQSNGRSTLVSDQATRGPRISRMVVQNRSALTNVHEYAWIEPWRLSRTSKAFLRWTLRGNALTIRISTLTLELISLKILGAVKRLQLSGSNKMQELLSLVLSR